jgi:hypothetical protein
VLTIGDASNRRPAGLQVDVQGDAAGLHAGSLVAETLHGDASSRRPGLRDDRRRGPPLRSWRPSATRPGSMPGAWLPRSSTATRATAPQLATIGDAAGLDAGSLVAETLHGDAGHRPDPATIGNASSRRPGLRGGLLSQGDAAGLHAGKLVAETFHGDAGHRSAAGEHRRRIESAAGLHAG